MAKLTYKARQKLPSKSFALPGKGTGKKGKGPGSYPIPDKTHGRNALARVAQHGTPAEKATVRAKVHRKFPDIGKKQVGAVVPRATVRMPRTMAVPIPRPPRMAAAGPRIAAPSRYGSAMGMRQGGVIPVIGSPKDHGTFKSMGIG
jgi:hypothetical protein